MHLKIRNVYYEYVSSYPCIPCQTMNFMSLVVQVHIGVHEKLGTFEIDIIITVQYHSKNDTFKDQKCIYEYVSSYPCIPTEGTMSYQEF